MTNTFSLTTLSEFAQMGAAYSRAGYDVATASYEKGPALLSSTIEEATILLSVGALAGLTAALVYFWRYAFLYPIQIVGGLCWDVFLCFLLCTFQKHFAAIPFFYTESHLDRFKVFHVCTYDYSPFIRDSIMLLTFP